MFNFIVHAAEADLPAPPTLDAAEGIFENIVIYAVTAAAFVLFLYLLMGGIRYITSGSNPQKVEGARNVITWAIYGALFVAFSYLIIRILETITGADLSTFRIVNG